MYGAETDRAAKIRAQREPAGTLPELFTKLRNASQKVMGSEHFTVPVPL